MNEKLIKVQYDISFQSLFRILIVLAIIWSIFQLGQLIVYHLFSIMFAVALRPLVIWFEKRGLQRGFALAVVLMLVTALLLLVLAVIAFALVRNLSGLWIEAPVYIEELKKYPQLAPYLDQIKVAVVDIDISKVVSVGIVNVGSVLSTMVGLINGFIVVFFLTVFMSLESEYLMRIIRSALPKNWKGRSKDIAPVAVKVIGGYIRGQALTSFLMFVAAFTIFSLLGIPNAFPLAIFAAITDIIPVVGGFIGVIPAVIVGFTVSPITGILAGLIMNGYQTFNNNYVTPRVYGSSLKLSPFFVMVSTIAGMALFGVVGILLALPVAALASFVVTEYMGIPILAKDDDGKKPKKKRTFPKIPFLNNLAIGS